MAATEGPAPASSTADAQVGSAPAPAPAAAWSVSALSEGHLAQLHRAVELALPQWLKPVPEEPERVVAALERVLLFLRQQGHPTQQARQVASLAFAFGVQVTRASGWRWMSVSEDGAVNPALVSPDGRRACLAVDVVTGLALARSRDTLTGLYRSIVEGGDAPALTRLDGAERNGPTEQAAAEEGPASSSTAAPPGATRVGHPEQRTEVEAEGREPLRAPLDFASLRSG